MDNNPVIALFLALGVIIAAARIAGNIARRFDQPRVLGELVIGVLLGPTLIDLLNASVFGLGEAHLHETIIEFAELGVLLLMFKVGLEIHLDELLKVGVVAAIAGVLGAVLPVVMAVPLVMAFGYGWQAALFAGVTLAATSVSISAQVLIELGVLRTKEGNALLATALIDDVVAILLVSLTIAITGPQEQVEASQLLAIVARMTGYILVSFVIAWFALPRLINWIDSRPESRHSYGDAAVALIIVLLFGWSAEFFGGVAAITGAFIAGVGLSRAHGGARREIDVAISNISYAFLVPIFFVSVGLQTDLSNFPLSALPLTALILVVAVASKIIGCGLGAKLGGFSSMESLRLGVCMISRGEVGLIIASLGLSSGMIQATDPLFASLFMVILLSTVLTPPLVRRVFELGKSAPQAHNHMEMQEVSEVIDR
ncbi:MAG: cation:proton antiporter [Anaerolineae bacterium]|nr:cation:proton antiporter [Anaerolineae bacterium]